MTIVKMPQLGESVTEGTIIQWLKQPGDPVKLDDPLCEIETEKVTAELPSEFEGTMGPILVPQGETVDVGTPLCEILAAGGVAQSAPVPAPSSGNGAWSGGPMAIPPDEKPVVLAPLGAALDDRAVDGGTDGRGLEALRAVGLDVVRPDLAGLREAAQVLVGRRVPDP